MRIAIIGSGISGMTAAYMLNKVSDITLFEADSRLGGHTATKDVVLDGRHYAVDTGFIVYNDWTYPNFIKLLSELGIEGKKTSMSFSVNTPSTGFEYSGTSLGTLFAQKRNLLNPRHYKMLLDIVRFNKEALADLEERKVSADITLGEYLLAKKYSEHFINRYIVPMGAAIWSSGTTGMMDFPMAFFLRFFKNHGLLSITNRPQWRVIPGGSREYIEPLTRSYQDKIRLSSPVRSVKRLPQGVSVTTDSGREYFDEVVFACHSNQALEILEDATSEERRILGAIPYTRNEVVLHTDISQLPKRPKAWSSWNYILGESAEDKAVLTYDMNILQGIESPHRFCVTMNNTAAIDPEKILGSYEYDHPLFTMEGVDAQQEWLKINGNNKTWFCGAYWFNGFHEDGVKSAIRVSTALGCAWGEDQPEEYVMNEIDWKKAS